MPGLIDKGTSRIALREEAGPKPNIIPSVNGLSITHKDRTEKHKARFFLGGHMHCMQKALVHNFNSLHHFSMRMILALVTILGLEICSCDVRQA